MRQNQAASLRATADTNALDYKGDIAKVEEWLGHASIATTRIYDDILVFLKTLT